MGKKVIIMCCTRDCLEGCTEKGALAAGSVSEKGKSFERFGKFSPSDVERPDRLQAVLFRCFEPASVAASMKILKQAKLQDEPCPFPEESLNELFGKVR